jgi:hypothetical protein
MSCSHGTYFVPTHRNCFQHSVSNFICNLLTVLDIKISRNYNNSDCLQLLSSWCTYIVLLSLLSENLNTKRITSLKCKMKSKCRAMALVVCVMLVSSLAYFNNIEDRGNVLLRNINWLLPNGISHPAVCWRLCDTSFVAFMAVIIGIVFLWVVTLCSFVEGHRRFGKACCLPIQVLTM